MEKVAIIGPIDELGQKTIRELLPENFEVISIDSEVDYDTLLPGVNYAILRTLTLQKTAIEKATNLKFIQRWGAGYDSVDIEYAGLKNIAVAVLTGGNAVPVSEYAVLLMLAVMRHIVQVHQNVLQGKGCDEALLANSYVIQGKKIGLVGLGHIGRKVAEKVQAFGAEVIYYDAVKLSADDEKKLAVRYEELEDLVKTSDVISIHVPLLESTRHLFDAKLMSTMKKNAILINTSRGGIIDETALYDLLKNEQIMGAGIDVFEHEPIQADNPLTQLSNIVLSAHCAGNTIDNSVVMGQRCVENILKISTGEKLIKPDLVNGQYLA